MAGTHTNMFFYSLSLIPPSTPSCASVIGQFSGAKQQEVVLATADNLGIYRVDTNTGKLQNLLNYQVFGIIRSISSFRLTGSSKDYIIVASDSGKITILEYKGDQNTFIKVHQETYGKSGVRRVVPGEYLAVDPKGRSAMIASMEKNRLVYVLNRDAAANLTISSPLEAHKSNSLLFHVVGLDVGYDNPIFASLEVDYGDADQDPSGAAYREVKKMLTYYELDLGLNHVVRRWTEVVDRNANLLIPVPGGLDGPSGVLVCTEDHVVYKQKGEKEHRLPIPRRKGPYEDDSRKRHIIASVTHKLKGSFFLLVQSEDGDLFKITLKHSEGLVESMSIKYFDTVPVAIGLNIFKSGYLFVASEFGNHHLYQFEKLGDEDDEEEFSSTDLQPNSHDFQARFRPRPLENLVLVDDIEVINPIMDAKVMNLTNEDSPQVYAICGKGPRSSFKIIRHGLEVTEVVASDLPGVPTAVWTTKLAANDEFDSYIVLSFTNGTLVLSIGETVEEVTETGFLSSAPTLAVQQLGDDALIQIHPKGIRHIRKDKRVNEWSTPQHRSIVQASTNTRQVVVALSSGELVYFELDSDGQLNEYQDRKEMSGSVTALSLGEVPEGRQRNPFLAVACDDSTVRIFSLDPDNTLEAMSVQALTAPASSLSMISMDDGNSQTLYLHIGLYNGVYLRTVLDTAAGQLTDTRTRFLGSKPVKLFKVSVHGQSAVLALSSRPWLGYVYNQAMKLTPMHYEALEHGCNFSSEQCPEGIVGIQGQSLRIFSVEKLGDRAIQETIPLSYTPRKFIKHPTEPYFYILEADHHALSADAKTKLLSGKQNGAAVSLPESEFGLPWGKEGSWASCIRVLDPVAKRSLAVVELEDNEAAFSLCTVTFKSQGNEMFLAVGTGKGTILAPKTCAQAYLHIYRFTDGGKGISLVHKTETSTIPLALLGFQGRLLAGVGGSLRVYEMGMKKCLRKAETEVTNNAIVGLHTQGNRIVIADNAESIQFAVYKYQENRIIVFANDTIPRWTTASVMLDYETVAGGDRFGNFWVVRCPSDVSELSDQDPSGSTLIHEKSYLMGSAHRLQLLAHYHLGDIPTSLHKTQLVAGGRDVVVYTGMMGGLGIFVPFISKEDVDFFQQLEAHMRSEDPPLIGRDHLVYRGYYAPPKGVIDGDLCERYSAISADKQRIIAGELDRDVIEVKKKVEDMRIRYGY